MKYDASTKRLQLTRAEGRRLIRLLDGLCECLEAEVESVTLGSTFQGEPAADDQNGQAIAAEARRKWRQARTFMSDIDHHVRAGQ